MACHPFGESPRIGADSDEHVTNCDTHGRARLALRQRRKVKTPKPLITLAGRPMIQWVY